MNKGTVKVLILAIGLILLLASLFILIAPEDIEVPRVWTYVAKWGAFTGVALAAVGMWDAVRANKLFAFIFFTFGCGLLQAWTLMLVKALPENGSFQPMVIFNDGGLYFFSTSLVFSSFLTLRSAPGADFSLGSHQSTMGFLLIGPTVLLAVVNYVYVLSQTPALTEPFATQRAYQLACVFCASVYAIYVAVVTGMFKVKT